MALRKRLHGSDTRGIDRDHYYEPEWRDQCYRTRIRLLRLLTDYDFKARRLKEGKEYDAPVGGWRDEPRKCSHCKLPTRFTTARGRSVHPACEGWVDTLTDRAALDLIYAVSDVLSVESVEVIRHGN
jgi:hypothetical protein